MAALVVTLATVGGLSAVMFLLKRFLRRGTYFVSSRLMHGKTVIVTGANCGIGKTTVQELAKLHARVILACRDVKKANKAVQDIRKHTSKGQLVVKRVDLLSQDSVRNFCKDILAEEERLDVLINNAAIMSHPFMLTEDNLEIHMAVNHFSNFLMTNLLLDLLKKTENSRIVFVSSSLHKYGNIDFNNINADRPKPYSNSKLANVYFARELHKRLQDSGVGVHTLHPGMVNTELSRYMYSRITRLLLSPLAGLLLKSPLDGCQTVLHCALSEELDGVSGKYYGNCKEEAWSKAASDDDIGQKLWEISEKLTGLNIS